MLWVLIGYCSGLVDASVEVPCTGIQRFRVQGESRDIGIFGEAGNPITKACISSEEQQSAIHI